MVLKIQARIRQFKFCGNSLHREGRADRPFGCLIAVKKKKKDFLDELGFLSMAAFMPYLPNTAVAIQIKL